MFKKILSTFLVFAVILTSHNTNTRAYSARAYCLYDPITKKVLASYNMQNKMPMASTTKIMTALIVCEICKLDDIVEITDEMIAVEGSSIGLQVGDKISYECLLYGLMLESGNDAALAIAVSISGSKENFAILMNERAKKIGMKSTNFVTPNGLDDEFHYTTAYDMALLGCVAMNNELLESVVGTKTYKAIYNSGETFRNYYNHNRLLSVLNGAEGIKTGFTKKSGRCLVSSCKRNGVRLIAVTLNDGNDWNDHKALYDYGFKQYEKVELPKVNKYVKVVGGTKTEIKVESNLCNIYFYDGLYSLIDKKVYISKFVYAPIKSGDKVGFVEYTYNGEVVTIADVIAIESSKKKIIDIPKSNIFVNIFKYMISIK